jgi:hypothetical protein
VIVTSSGEGTLGSGLGGWEPSPYTRSARLANPGLGQQLEGVDVRGADDAEAVASGGRLEALRRGDRRCIDGAAPPQITA